MMRSIGKARRWMVQQLPRTYRATARTVGTVSGRDARRSVRLLREEVTRLRERAYANGFSVPSSEHVAVLDCLGPRELSVRSQNGEDGVIQALLGVTGVGNRTFFEIGVEAGRECNTRALAEFRGWSGTMVDGDKAKVVAGRAEHARERLGGLIHFEQRFVTVDNVMEIIDGLETAPHLISIDVDGNDYWIWEAVTTTPAIVIVEYNASCGPTRACTVPYQADFTWEQTGEREYFHGASLVALASLGESKGYALVHADAAGANAFFVRTDLLPADWKPADPSRLWRRHDSRSRFVDPTQQEAICRTLPFVEV